MYLRRPLFKASWIVEANAVEYTEVGKPLRMAACTSLPFIDVTTNGKASHYLQGSVDKEGPSRVGGTAIFHRPGLKPLMVLKFHPTTSPAL